MTTKTTQSFTQRICYVLLCHACDLCTVTQNKLQPCIKNLAQFATRVQMINIFKCISDDLRGQQADNASAVTHQSLPQCGPVRMGGGLIAAHHPVSRKLPLNAGHSRATFPAAPPPSPDCKSNSRRFPLQIGRSAEKTGEGSFGDSASTQHRTLRDICHLKGR